MQNTPQIVVAREAGACYGVNRALDLVREAAEGEGGPIHTLGPLIHNPTVVAELESKGVGVVESPEEVSGGTIVLRTHGVPPAEEKSAREACPFVLRAHKAAERLDAEGYQVIVFGEAGHPEVLGTLGHAREPLVIEDPSQLEGVEVGRKVGVVVQTTQSRARLRELVCALLGRADEVRVIDTICEATSLRQAAAAELAGRADVMVVIGGRNSANTCRLAQICGESCARVHHIEVAGELEASNFEGAETIGVTAGASTPQTQIDEVCERICELSGGELAPEGER